MKFSYSILFFCVTAFCFSVKAQTVMIDGVPRDTSYTVYSTFIKLKKQYPFIRPVETKISDDLACYENIPYKTISTERKLILNIYRRKGNELLPVVLMIHGGGWNSGSPALQKAMAFNLARKGFVAITVEYRLIPEAIFPAAVDDLEDAVKWIVENAGTYRINRDKITVSGCSAGGQLAALIGTKNKDKLIKAVINIDGISTFIDKATIDRSEKARTSGDKMPVDALWLGGTFSESPDNWKAASALTWVNKNSAPVCFINSSIPRFHNGRDEHIRMLDSLGIYSEVHVFDNSPHSFWHFHPWQLSTVQYVANFLNKIFDKSSNAIDHSKYDIVVAQDGSGDFKTVQEAINAVPDFRKRETRIFIRNGFYREKIIIPETKDSLTLIGEDRNKTILSYNNFASKSSGFGDQLGTSGSASVYICSPNFMADNLTFENAAGPIGQAVAAVIRSDKARFINCKFLGFQDTLYPHKDDSRQYYKNCYIEGTVDFIFGFSTAYFDSCELYCKESGFVTAAATPQESNYGFVFYRCKMKGDNPASFYLGRPWRPYAKVAFIECDMTNVIKPEGWDNWGKVSNEKTAQFSEYQNSGEGGNLSNRRVKWSKTLSSRQVKNFDKEIVLGKDFFEKKEDFHSNTK
ncbi:pectinesterase family protein [Porphyromonadaceae sp. NP-X]|nr:pectinesterase family protein [Porphyromonadaceae sp. NP-X]